MRVSWTDSFFCLPFLWQGALHSEQVVWWAKIGVLIVIPISSLTLSAHNTLGWELSGSAVIWGRRAFKNYILRQVLARKLGHNLVVSTADPEWSFLQPKWSTWLTTENGNFSTRFVLLQYPCNFSIFHGIATLIHQSKIRHKKPGIISFHSIF